MASETTVIPPRSGAAFGLGIGERMSITDCDGAQIADTFAFVEGTTGEWLSASHTRTALRRLRPRVGDTFVSNHYRPLLTLTEDTSPGAHNMLYPACDRYMYERMGADASHPSCFGNFHQALAIGGHRPRLITDPVNFFQNSSIGADSSLRTLDAVSSAGDMVRLTSHADLLVVVTACSQDLVRINGASCSSLLVTIERARSDQ